MYKRQAIARGRDDEALRCIARWQELCGDRFYLEVQRTGRADEAAYSEAVAQLTMSVGTDHPALQQARALLVGLPKTASQKD